MLRSVLAKTIRDHRRGFAWWALGLAGTVWFTIGVYPTVRDLPELARLAEDYPEALKSFFGLGGLDLLSPAGYLSAELFSFLVPLVLLAQAIGLGSAALAREEEEGTLDLLLSCPVSRRRLVAEKAAAVAGLAVGLGAVLLASLWAGALAVGMDISAGRLAQASASAVLLALAFGGIALLVGCATGRRALAAGTSAAVAVAAYLLYGLAPLVDALEPTQKLSPYYLYAGNEPLRNGLDALHAGILGALALASAALAVAVFERRDLRV